MDSSTKYRTFSKAGITLICPGCEQTDTYQIGQFDREKWAIHRGKHWCRDCRGKFPPLYLPAFKPQDEESKNDIDKLLELI